MTSNVCHQDQNARMDGTQPHGWFDSSWKGANTPRTVGKIVWLQLAGAYNQCCGWEHIKDDWLITVIVIIMKLQNIWQKWYDVWALLCYAKKQQNWVCGQESPRHMLLGQHTHMTRINDTRIHEASSNMGATKIFSSAQFIEFII